MKHSGDDVDVTEIVEPHSLVAGPFNAIGSSDALDHIVSCHHGGVFRVDKIRREQSIEGARVALDQCRRPLILELDRRKRLSWRDRRGLRSRARNRWNGSRFRRWAATGLAVKWRRAETDQKQRSRRASHQYLLYPCCLPDATSPS